MNTFFDSLKDKVNKSKMEEACSKVINCLSLSKSKLEKFQKALFFTSLQELSLRKSLIKNSLENCFRIFSKNRADNISFQQNNFLERLNRKAKNVIINEKINKIETILHNKKTNNYLYYKQVFFISMDG